jgi:stage III sporulation protein AG
VGSNVKKAAFQTLFRKYRYPALILALGLVLLMIPTGGKTQQEEAETEAETETEAFQLETFTAQAQALLSGISGAGEVQLLLSLDTDGTRRYLYDESQSQSDSGSQKTVDAVLARVSGDEEPVSVETTYPSFRGAVVLCQGADTPGVVLAVKEALSSLTGLGMDKITVLKMD